MEQDKNEEGLMVIESSKSMTKEGIGHISFFIEVEELEYEDDFNNGKSCLIFKQLDHLLGGHDGTE